MLGKGLESLIPQKGSGNGGNGAAGQGGVAAAGMPAAGTSPPRAEPALSPLRPPISPAGSMEPTEPAEPFLPAEPKEQFLPVKPAEPELPAPAQEPELPAAASAMPAMSAMPAPRPESVFQIEPERIKPNPDQPRRHFDEAALRDLANSIREFGFLQPLVVSKIEKETPTGVAVEYQLIAGERRLLAAKLLGLASVPAIVRNVDLAREKLELAVIENIQRENLNPIETARAFQRLQEEFRMTQREIAAKLGKSRESVANAVRLLDLPESMRDEVEKGALSESHARLLLAISDPSAREQLFRDIMERHLTIREARERAEAAARAAAGAGGGTAAAGSAAYAAGGGGMHAGSVHRRGRPPKSAETPLPPELAALKESLSSDLGAPVEIHQGAAKGSITITFYSKEELENIMRRLGKE